MENCPRKRGFILKIKDKTGLTPALSYGKDASLLKPLFKTLDRDRASPEQSREEMKRLIISFLNDPAVFDYSVGFFYKKFNALRLGAKKEVGACAYQDLN